MIARRLAFLALAAGMAACVAPAEARPRAVAQAGITVDVSRLKALGLGPTADVVQATVAQELAGGLASARSGGRVVVRLIGLSMSSYAGSDSSSGGGAGGGGMGGSGGGSAYDYLEGDLLVLGPRGEVLAQHHQVSSSPANSGGPYYLPGADRRRVEAVSRNFAAWLKRSGM